MFEKPEELKGKVSKFEDLLNKSFTNLIDKLNVEELDEQYMLKTFKLQELFFIIIYVNRFYMQPFEIEMASKYFTGIKVDKHFIILLNTSYEFLIVSPRTMFLQWTPIKKNHEVIFRFPTPKTLGDFIAACKNSNIELIWK